MKLVILFASLLSAAFGLVKLNDPFPDRGHHIEKFKVIATSPPPSHLANPMNRTMEVTFIAANKRFFLDLHLKTFLYSPDAQLIVGWKKNGDPILHDKFHRTFEGSAVIHPIGDYSDDRMEHGKATVTFHLDGIMEGTIITDNEMYTIDLDNYNQGAFPLEGKNNGHGMHVVLMSEFNSEVVERFKRKHNLPNEAKTLMTNPTKKKLLQQLYWNNCFSGQNLQRAINVALVADKSYYGMMSFQAGSTVPTYSQLNDDRVITAMKNTLAQVSDVYSRQFDVYLLVGTVLVGNAVDGLTFDQDSFVRDSTRSSSRCSDTANTRLVKFRDYRRQYRSQHSDTNALWHLFTDCHPPPGTVGIAYIGVLCDSRYSVGLTSYTSSAGTWLTAAHELGHNFGAPHSFEDGQYVTGGIMDYGDGKYNGYYQFHSYRENDICGAIQKSVTSLRPSSYIPIDQCWTTYAPATPIPTPQPTAPTPKPTPKPTQPISTPKPTRVPTVRPTIYPTLRPTKKPTVKPTDVVTPKPTKKPTRKPTNKPTTPPTNPLVTTIIYKWVATGTYGSCQPSCGTQIFQTEILNCVQETTYSDGRSPVTVVMTTVPLPCDVSMKPQPNAKPCSPNPCPAVCGNGVPETGEVCDTGIDPVCCKADCSGYTDTIHCLEQNCVITGAFQICLDPTHNSQCSLYLLQGDYFRKYDYVDSTTDNTIPAWSQPLPVYPNLQNAYPGRVTASVAVSNQQLYLFVGTKFVHVDFSQGTSSNEISRGDISSWGVPPNILTCGIITGAAPYFDFGLIVFCHAEWTLVWYESMTSLTAVYPSAYFTGGTDSPDVSSAYFDARLQQFRLIGGCTQTSTRGQFVAPTSRTTTTSIWANASTSIGPLSELCVDINCVPGNCVNRAVCTKCLAGYRSQFGRCVNEFQVLEMDFDKNGKLDAFYSSDPQLQTLNYTNGFDGKPDSAIIFSQNTVIKASVPNYPNISDFGINFWYKPTSVNGIQTVLTIDKRFSIGLENKNGQTMTLYVSLDENWFDCYVSTPLRIDTWNKINVEFAGNEVLTGTNWGAPHRRAFQVVGDNFHISLNFKDIEIGHATNGLHGAVDTFTIRKIVRKNAFAYAATEEIPAQTAMIVGIVVPIVFCCCLALVAFICYRNGMCGRKTRGFHSPTQASRSTAGGFIGNSGQQNIVAQRQQSESISMSNRPTTGPPMPPRPPPPSSHTSRPPPPGVSRTTEGGPPQLPRRQW